MDAYISPAQRLRPVKEALGFPVLLRPYQELIEVTVTDEAIMVLTTVKSYTETTKEVRFHKSGTQLLSWKKEDGRWVQQETLTAWDEEDDNSPMEVRYGYSLSEREYKDRLEWEAMTYRCGTPRTPLDSFERAVWGDTSDSMFQYWTGHSRALGYTSEKEPDE